MNYPNGVEAMHGDVVKLRHDTRFTGSGEDGHMLALCRYGTVLDIWENNQQISVRFTQMQDVLYASNNPEHIQRSIFEHDAYTFPNDLTFVERHIDALQHR